MEWGKKMLIIRNKPVLFIQLAAIQINTAFSSIMAVINDFNIMTYLLV